MGSSNSKDSTASEPISQPTNSADPTKARPPSLKMRLWGEDSPEETNSKLSIPPTITKFPEKLHKYTFEIADRRSPHEQALMDQVDKLPFSIQAGDPMEAQFLKWLCSTISAKKAIEVGVFRGTTTLALALALPEDGKVVALDISTAYADEVQTQNIWADAGVSNKIDLRCGPAMDSLDGMLAAGEENTYDFAFIDADKANYEGYYERCLSLLKVGGVIAIDNVFLHGTVFDENHPDGTAIHSLNTKLKTDERVDLTTLTISDGLTLVRKL